MGYLSPPQLLLWFAFCRRGGAQPCGRPGSRRAGRGAAAKDEGVPGDPRGGAVKAGDLEAQL